MQSESQKVLLLKYQNMIYIALFIQFNLFGVLKKILKKVITNCH